MKRVTKTNVIFTATILVQIILTFSLRLVPRKLLTYNLLLIIPEVVILLAALGIAKILNVETLKEPKLTKVSIGTCIKSILLAFFCMPLVGFVSALTSGISGNTASNAISKITDNPLWLSLFLLAVVPAVVEEYVFRGLLFLGYKKRNPLKAALLSAMLFGLIHFNINQFSYAFVLGIVLALLVYATGSIIPGMLVHFTINGYSVVASYLINKKNDVVSKEVIEQLENTNPSMSELIVSFMFTIFFIMAMTSIAFLIFRSICKHNRGINGVANIFKKEMWNSYADEGKFVDGYLILGIIICVAFIIYFDFIS